MNLLERFGFARQAARIGPVGPQHTARLSEIHASAFARPWDADEFDTFLIDPSVRIDGLFIGREPQPVGFVLSRKALDEAEILSLALARSARGRGDARRLMAEHLQALAHGGVKTVHLEVEEGNHPALALYRRLGFTTTGHRPGYYTRPDGTRASALSMTLQLGPAEAGRGT